MPCTQKECNCYDYNMVEVTMYSEETDQQAHRDGSNPYFGLQKILHCLPLPFVSGSLALLPLNITGINLPKVLPKSGSHMHTTELKDHSHMPCVVSCDPMLRP